MKAALCVILCLAAAPTVTTALADAPVLEQSELTPSETDFKTESELNEAQAGIHRDEGPGDPGEQRASLNTATPPPTTAALPPMAATAAPTLLDMARQACEAQYGP